MRRLTFALGLLLGCNGTETGNPVEDGMENTGGAGCEAVSSSALALDAQSSLGFSANDVLGYAGGTHSEALRWQALSEGSYGPETGQQTLTLTLTGRSAKLVQYANSKNTELATNCGPQVEIDADVTVRSSGGALNESARTTLVAARRELASFRVRFDPEKLSGSLTLTPPSGFTTTEVTLSAQLTPYAASGAITPTFEQRRGENTGVAAAQALATFGLPPCAYGVAVPLSATGAASSASTLALLAQHTSATFGGNEATLTFEPSGNACQFFGDPYSPEPNPVLVIPGALRVKASGIDGSWPVQVRTMPDASGQLHGPVSVQLDGQSPASVPALGFTQIDTSGYDSTGAQVSLSLDPSGWSGAVDLYGYKNASCPQPEPGSNSSPGCPGADRSVLGHLEVM